MNNEVPELNGKENKGLLVLRPPRLVLITGVGGSGKTSVIGGLPNEEGMVSPGLKNYLQAEIVSKDTIADSFSQLRDETYVGMVRSLVYNRLFQRITECLERKTTVIVDASFRKEIETSGWEKPYFELAKEKGAVLKIVRLLVAEEVLLARLRNRKSIYDDHKLVNEETWRAYLREEPIRLPMSIGTLEVDNRDEFSAVVATILDFISGP